MNLALLWTIFQNIGSAVGILITLGTFITIIAKKPKEILKKIIVPIIKESTQDRDNAIIQGQQDIIKRLDESDLNDLTSFRHSITGIYYKYKDKKKMPIYVKEDLVRLYDRYEKLGGNSYVHQIYQEMNGWETE